MIPVLGIYLFQFSLNSFYLFINLFFIESPGRLSIMGITVWEKITWIFAFVLKTF